MMAEVLPLILFLLVCTILLLGYPVAFSLGGTSLLFALLGGMNGYFDDAFLQALPNRLYGIMTNETLIAVPLFVFMGIMLERSRVAEHLLDTMASLFGSLRGGLGISVTLVGMLLAASTGIVGATVVTMGLLSLPTMLKRHYDPAISCGDPRRGHLGPDYPTFHHPGIAGRCAFRCLSASAVGYGAFLPRNHISG
jgi:TRAP-type mannitol/chloroaromatic compound transport system permease large subunit